MLVKSPEVENSFGQQVGWLKPGATPPTTRFPLSWTFIRSVAKRQARCVGRVLHPAVRFSIF